MDVDDFDRAVVHIMANPWCLMSIPRVLFDAIAFSASSIAGWLSSLTWIGDFILKPVLVIIFRTQRSSLTAIDMAMYSASVLERAVEVCSLEP